MTKDKNKQKKIQTSMQLTPSAKKIIELLAAKIGVSQAAILEIAIRQLAKTEELILE